MLNGRYVVTLCGSMSKAHDALFAVAAEQTGMGHIVLAPFVVKGSEHDVIDLDALHRDKIDVADEILFVVMNGYMGESTTAEFAYTQSQGKPFQIIERGRVVMTCDTCHSELETDGVQWCCPNCGNDDEDE